MSRMSSSGVNLVLQLKDALPADTVESIASSLSRVSGCNVNSIPSNGPGMCFKASVQVPNLQGVQHVQPHSAEAVLQATAWLEHNAQATAELVQHLQQKGLPEDAHTSAKSTNAVHGSSKPISSSSSSSPVRQPRPADQPAALSPAGPEGSSVGEDKGQQSMQQQVLSEPQQLLPLLQRCGLLVSVFPEHDHDVTLRLEDRVWTSFLAPVTEFRHYFGDQVGFYLAYLNALTCWLLAPAAASSFLMWALGGTGMDRTGLSSPLIPIIVIFQLLWSAAGVKLWRRHQALLNRQWHPTSHTPASNVAPHNATETSRLGSVTSHTQHLHPAGSVEGSPISFVSSGQGSAGANRQASLNYSHFRGGVPEWAVQAPTASGTRWQFTGAWTRNAKGQWQLQAPLVPQLLRVAASIFATFLLLLLAAAVLVACLNLQGLIAPSHSLLFMPRLAALSLSEGLLGQGLLKQVPMVVRVLAVSLYDAYIFGPAAKALTAFENRRTLEGFDASLTAKKSALMFLFTFAPVAYVGLAGAGAAAAANDAAGYFKYELLRRIVMEFVMPWVSLLLATRRKAASKRQRQQQSQAQQKPQARVMQASSAVAQHVGTIGTTTVSAADQHSSVGSYVTAAFSDADQGKHHGSAGKQLGAADVDSDVLRPQFDPFTGIWDVTRDMGYVMLFASILPWAAPITLLYTLAKIKQDCMSLLSVYQRPMPRQMRNLGSWNTVLLVQVFMAIVTNVFLSGLSSGQLAQLLPSWLVPAGLSYSLTAAAAARPTDSTATASVGQSAGGWALGPFRTLESISAGSWYPYESYRSSLGPFSIAPYMCPVPSLYNSLAGLAVCPLAHAQSLQQPRALHAATVAAGDIKSWELDSVSTDSNAATSHMLLLFALEHVVLLLVVLVLKLVPDEPGSQGSRPAPPEVTVLPAAGSTHTCIAGTAHTQQQPVLQPQVVTRVSAQPGAVLQQRAIPAVVQAEPHVAQIAVPMSVHGNPLLTQSTAQKSKAL